MINRERCRLLSVLLAGVLGVAVLSRVTHDGASNEDLAWAVVSSCGGATVQPGCVDHFQCYEAKPAFFTPLTVTVQDQFGTLTEGIRYPHRLCAPANKNGEGILDPTDHLAGYATKPSPFTRKVNQTVVDQFGTQLLDVVRPDVLMVPTSKDGVPLAMPVDHFQCYKVKRSKGGAKFAKRTVSVADQFESVTVTLVKPILLCAPANKNNEDPTAPSHPDHLTCYKTADGKFLSSTHTIDNQFGTDQVTLIHRRELCVPSIKNPPTTTTSTTSTTQHATTTTSTTSSTQHATTTTSSTTTTTQYGSPSRAFLEPTRSLLD
jgi:hypothetical protein